jgi:hypothetical protein
MAAKAQGQVEPAARGMPARDQVQEIYPAREAGLGLEMQALEQEPVLGRELEEQAVHPGPVLEPARGAQSQEAVLGELALGVARAVVHLADKALTPALSRAAELFSAEQEQALPEVAGLEEAVPEAWVLVAPAA